MLLILRTITIITTATAIASLVVQIINFSFSSTSVDHRFETCHRAFLDGIKRSVGFTVAMFLDGESYFVNWATYGAIDRVL